MKFLEVLPNFTVLAQCTPEYSSLALGALRCFCEVVSSAEHVDTYRITPASFWQGLNRTQGYEVNFIALLKEHSEKQIPENVLKELESFEKKFGVISLIGNDALLVKSNDILKEIQNSSSMDKVIYEVEGNVIFFKDISFNDIQEIFQYEFNHPIKYRQAKILDFIIDDGTKKYCVKASNSFQALKAIYNNHPFLNEDDLVLKGNVKKVTEEAIDSYVQNVLDNPSDSTCRFKIAAVPFLSFFKTTTI